MPNIVVREIFNSLPTIDGRYSEWSQEKRDEFIKELYDNTKRWLSYAKKGAQTPITKSHFIEDEELHGKLLDVKLKKKNDPTDHFVLIGKLEIDEEYYKLYQENKLPATSIVIYDSANLHGFTGKEDDSIGSHIGEVALLGTTPAAIPSLVKLSRYEDIEIGGLQIAHSYFSAKRTRKKSHKKEKKERFEMPEFKEKLMEFGEMLTESIGMAITATIEKFVSEDEPDSADADDDNIPAPGFDAETPPESDPAHATPAGDVNTQILEQLKKMNGRIDNLETHDKSNQNEKSGELFKRLTKEGKLIAEQEKEFSTMVKKNGLELVDNFFSKAHPQVPAPSGIEHVDMNDEKAIKETAEYKKWFAKFTESGRHTPESFHEAALQAMGMELTKKQKMVV